MRGEVLRERKVLIDRLDAESAYREGRLMSEALAAEPDLPPIRRKDAGKDLDQAALACAVVADKGDNLRLADDKVDTPQRLHVPERLDNIPCLKQRLRRRRFDVFCCLLVHCMAFFQHPLYRYFDTPGSSTLSGVATTTSVRTSFSTGLPSSAATAFSTPIRPMSNGFWTTRLVI